MKSNKIYFIVIFVLLSVFTAVYIVMHKQNDSRSLLYTMLTSTVDFPGELVLCSPDSIHPNFTIDSEKAKVIIYFSDSGCMPCNVTHLPDYQWLYDIVAGCDVLEIYPIFSADVELVRTVYDKTNCCYPVYIDPNNDFEKSNPFIPKESRYHTMIVDKNNKVVMVGNPLSGDKMYEVFKKIIKNIIGNNGVYVGENHVN